MYVCWCLQELAVPGFTHTSVLLSVTAIVSWLPLDVVVAAVNEYSTTKGLAEHTALADVHRHQVIPCVMTMKGMGASIFNLNLSHCSCCTGFLTL